MYKLITVCTGNTCRSPFAAAYFNKLFAEAGVEACAVSAGIAVCTGERPCANAVFAAGKYGLSPVLAEHTATQLTLGMLTEADCVVGVTPSHLRRIKEASGSLLCGKKLVSLGNIADPYLGSAADYEHCYEEISVAADRLLPEIAEACTAGEGGKI